MSRLVSLAAGTILDVDPVAAVGVALDGGFEAVGIWFDPATWTDQVARDVRRRLDETGLIALDIEPIMLTRDGDHGDRIVDAALIVGARNILVASRDSDLTRVGERLAALAEKLAGTNVRLVLEFLPVLGIRTLDQAIAVVGGIDSPNVGILVDNLHLARAGHSPGDLRSVDGELLPYLQICDAPLLLADTSVPVLLHEALHGRLLPGEGELPIAELLGTVPNVPLSLELRSEHLRTTYPDPVERARIVRASMDRYNDN